MGHASRRATLLGAAGALGLAACSDDKGSSMALKGGKPTASRQATGPAGPPQLPRGGRTIFPSYRLFGYCGSPASPALGQLGVGNLDEQVGDMLEKADDYAYGRKIMPVLELIATLVHGKRGHDGKYRSWVGTSVVDDYLAAARRHKALLLLNIQPGRASFIDEVKHWESYLKEPDVGVALDPEWAVQRGQIPGRVFGSTTGHALDECASYLSELVAKHRLPEKVMVYHQLHLSIVRHESALRPHPGVVLVKSVDGIGRAADKIRAYDKIVAQTPAAVHKGFKLFFEEDARTGPLMRPSEVMALKPQPEYVLYE
ncbi:hypothetical protein VV02_04755 [Luteipulveratus mongoliensis]|uniref:Lipoprotein n=2 Tax=Luteipulveratus mongoliensis TaxID=571913 RepID=A0A0K1JFH6_9MICO|nr:hypothetical protein VV02_04755 [Luteipulveratus mongoliensis]